MNWHFDFHLQWLFLGECLKVTLCFLMKDWMFPRLDDISWPSKVWWYHAWSYIKLIAQNTWKTHPKWLLLLFKGSKLEFVDIQIHQVWLQCSKILPFGQLESKWSFDSKAFSLYNDNTLIFILRCQIEDTWCHSFESSFNLSVNRQAEDLFFLAKRWGWTRTTSINMLKHCRVG